MTQIQNNETNPQPAGELILRSMASKSDQNIYGDIGATWVIEQMEHATQLVSAKFNPEKIATVAISQLDFTSPIKTGEQIDIYAQIAKIGKTSIQIELEVWRKLNSANAQKYYKVTGGTFVVVALDANGRIKVEK